MDFQMKLKFMRLTTEEIPFTNWVKPDFDRTFDITLKISASPRLRERYWLGARSLRCGNCFSRITFFNPFNRFTHTFFNPFNRIAHTFFNPFEGDSQKSTPMFHNHPTTRVS